MNRLITIPFSHYCEKARWGLERAGVPFREEAHPPILHWASSLRTARSRTVPVLQLDGTMLTDSTDIIDAIDARKPGSLWPVETELREQARAWEEKFDRSLGPAVRRVMYFLVMKDPSIARRVLGSGPVPGWQRAAVRVGYPLIAGAIQRGLKIDQPGVRRSRKRLDEVFDEVSERLSDGRKYLVGDRFTAADLTFASLASVVLAPDQHPFYVKIDEVPAEPRELIENYRRTPAGEYGLRLYREERALG
jgi:glutathione S-transferase